MNFAMNTNKINSEFEFAKSFKFKYLKPSMMSVKIPLCSKPEISLPSFLFIFTSFVVRWHGFSFALVCFFNAYFNFYFICSLIKSHANILFWWLCCSFYMAALWWRLGHIFHHKLSWKNNSQLNCRLRNERHHLILDTLPKVDTKWNILV